MKANPIYKTILFFNLILLSYSGYSQPFTGIHFTMSVEGCAQIAPDQLEFDLFLQFDGTLSKIELLAYSYGVNFNSLILNELRKFREISLTKTQLQNTKDQLMGQMAMSEEGNMSFMLMMAKSLLDMNRIDGLEDLFVQIKAVTATQLQDLANEMFREEDLSYLTFLPE